MEHIYTTNFEVGIHECRTRGWFEHNELGDECGGGLWFHDNALIDYDGVYELPKEVVNALAANGIDVEYCTQETDDD